MEKKNGEFLQLLASIAVLIDDLSQKLEKAAAALEEATRQAQEAQNQVELATAAFRKAVEAANLEKQEITNLVGDLEQQNSIWKTWKRRWQKPKSNGAYQRPRLWQVMQRRPQVWQKSMLLSPNWTDVES